MIRAKRQIRDAEFASDRKTSFDVQVVEMDFNAKEATKAQSESVQRGSWLRTAAGHELLEDGEQLPVLGHGSVGLRRVLHHRAARLVHLTNHHTHSCSEIVWEKDETHVSDICTKIAKEVCRRSFEKNDKKLKYQNICTKCPLVLSHSRKRRKQSLKTCARNRRRIVKS